MKPFSRFQLRHALSLVVLPALVVASAAKCNPPEPAPVGSIDSVIFVGERLQISGWAGVAGRDVPVWAHVTVDGGLVRSGRTDLPRGDVNAAGYPGALRGFTSFSGPLSPGRHTWCVAVEREGTNKRLLVNCGTADVPQLAGTFDGFTVNRNSVTAFGWAFDPLDQGSATGIDISLARPGAGAPFARQAVAANQPRDDVNAAFGVAGQHGFSATFSNLDAGTYIGCAAIQPSGTRPGGLLGCKEVAVVTQPPRGAVVRITSPTAGQIRVIGWAAASEDGRVVPVQIVAGGTTRTVNADAARPAGIAALNSDGPGGRWYDVTLTVPAGATNVCVSAVGPDGWSRTNWPCGTSVSAAQRLATSGAPLATGPVAPPPGHPLRGIDRDGGISTRLRDGRVFWLFGDSAEKVGGSYRYFLNNTAAIAPANSPGTPDDAVVSGAPVQFVTPTGALGPCPVAGQVPALWPLSAVDAPIDAGTDRVLAYFENMCVSTTGGASQSRGIAVVEWREPAGYTVGSPIQGTILNEQLFADRAYGQAAVVDGDVIYSYTCQGPEQGGWPDQYGPCRVARVGVADVANAAKYEYWTGAAWSPSRSAAGALDLPAGANGAVPPVGGLTVTYDVAFNRYVMAYSTWPGYSSHMAIRIASSPTGPWSAPAIVELPGCFDTVGGSERYCYAASAQPALSSGANNGMETTGFLGVGYFDQYDVSVGHGQYRWAQVPFSISR
jgi:hypothetical protein